MDFKKLSAFIIGFGAFLFASGALWYLSNLPLAESRSSFDPDRSDANLFRSAERGDAMGTMFFGAIVAFAGVAVRASAKTSASESAAPPEPPPTTAINPADVLCPFCLKPLERHTLQARCPHCFRQLPPPPPSKSPQSN
jgi:hypothetical protein